MDKTQLSKLLDNYVNGICTPEEIAIINKWYDQYETGTPGYVSTLSDMEREALKRRMFAKIMVNEVEETEALDETVRVLPVARKWWFAAAAAAVALVFIKIFIFAPHTAPVNNTALTSYIEFVNNTETIAKQVLPDNSTVWLAPHSSLSYPKVFAVKSRNVAMKGECFFEVTKNPARPFIINSYHLITKVWGTSFRVTDYSNKATATVIVMTGKVSVSKKDDKTANETVLIAGEVMLHPKEEIIYHAEKAMPIKAEPADMASLNIWNHADVSFDNTPLKEIVSVLNKKFNAHIIIKDKVLSQAVMNADLTDLNLPEMLEVLKASLKCDYEVNGDRIMLKRTN